MPSRNARNVSLTDELCDFIADEVEAGRFRTASEVVRAALRLLMQEAATSSPTRVDKTRQGASMANAISKREKRLPRSQSPRS